MVARRRRAPREKQHPGLTDAFLTEVDRFLEDGADAVSAGVRRNLEDLPPPASAASRPPAASSPQEPADEVSHPPPAPEVRVVDDGLRALIRAVHPEHTTSDIKAALHRSGITIGIATKAIVEAVEQARSTQRPVNDVVAAEGRPPKPPSAPRVKFRHPESLKGMPRLDSIQALLKETDPSSVETRIAQLAAWNVAPGTLLGTIVRAEGTPGLDVEGNPIPVPEVDDPALRSRKLEPGPGVEFANDDTELRAAVYGCAGLLAKQVTVLAPLWLTPDSMEAYFVRLARVAGSQLPTAGHLEAMLRSAGVTVAVDSTRLQQRALEVGSKLSVGRLISLARGRAPVPPRDPEVKQTVDYGLRPGAFRTDGSVDFRERNVFPRIEKDSELLILVPPRPGTPGVNLLGEDIPVPPPATVTLAAGEHVRLEVSDTEQRLVADAQGSATLQTERRSDEAGNESVCHTVAVRETASIDGDVDYHTGNVDFLGNIVVSGSVQSGFRIRSSGSIVIKGSVEAGAAVTAVGDITVGQGIVGQDTRIHSDTGSITAKFVHDAHLEAGTEVRIGRYMHGADVRAGEAIAVEGLGGTGGGIIGGITWATREVRTPNLGSDRSTNTGVYVGVAPGQHAKTQELGRNMRQAERMLQRLLLALELPALEPAEIRRLIARVPARKKVILHYVKKAQQLVLARERYQQQYEELTACIARTAAGAAVMVQGRAHDRCVLHIGSQEWTLEQSFRGVRFALDQDADKIIAAEL